MASLVHVLMATKLFMHDARSDFGTGNNDNRLTGTAQNWMARLVNTTQGSALVASRATSTQTGPIAGVEVQHSSTVRPIVWYSPPLAAAATISGSITWNIWASESDMSANVAINGRLEVIDGATGTITLIDQTARTTEVAITTRAVNNFAETPAAGVACKKGDRLRVRIFGDDAGTMAAGFTFNIGYDAGSGVDGDTWLNLTETLSFVSEPAGSEVFLTDTASDVSTASVDREAWTSRGAGVQTDVTNTATGYTAPIQVTDTAGGTVVDWFTKALTGFTLGGAVRVNLRVANSAATSDGEIPRCEIARVANDGTGATVWGATSCPVQDMTSSEAAFSFLVSGDDLAISAGQRLRIRFFVDDGSLAMTAGRTITLYYAGAAGATGDTYLTFTQTLTESAPAEQIARPIEPPNAAILAY